MRYLIETLSELTSSKFGGLVMNIIARGTQSITTKNAYIIPYGLFYIVPSIVALSIWFVPEVGTIPSHRVIQDSLTHTFTVPQVAYSQKPT